jgi:hypothetical protein
MNDWSVDNFLERLMPGLQGRHTGMPHSCPDEESLCAYAEDRAAGVVRDGIAAHLKECELCAELFRRLQDFATPRVPLAEAEWTRAEKRLENWMDGFLLTETRRVPVATPPVVARGETGESWFSAWRYRWAFAAAAAIVVSGATYLILFGPAGDYLQTAMHRPAPTAPIDAQSRPEAPPTSPVPTEVSNPATQTGQPNSTNPPTRTESARGSSPGAQAPPAAPSAPNQNAPLAPPASIQVYTAQNPPASPSNERPGNHGAQIAPQPQVAQPTGPAAGGYQNAAVVTSEVKAAVVEQVKLQLVAERTDAVNPRSSDTANDNQTPGALDPAHRVFIVSSVLSEQATDGQQCSLVPGDILTRVMDTPDANLKVTAMVTSSQRNDCGAGSMLAVSVEDLQEMRNDFVQKLDDGLQHLVDNQGKNGMPASPAAGGHANPYGQAQPDLTAQADLQQQQQEARNAEDEVEQATAGYVPSAFHLTRKRPAESEELSRADDESQQISRAAERGGLTLAAWSLGTQQSNVRPQQNPPAKPASPPKNPSPSAAPRPAPAQPSRSTVPAKTSPAPAPRPANTSQQKQASGGTAKPGPAIVPKATTSKAPLISDGKGRADGSGFDRNRISRFTPPRGSTAIPDGKGGTSFRTSNGTEYHVGNTGRISSVTTRSGATAQFTSSGRIASIHTARGMTINRGPNGQRRIETVRTDGTRVISTGRNRGFVEHPFARGNRTYVQRTYVVGSYRYARVYGRYYYRGGYFYHYVPAYYFAPAFYGWAYNPWRAPVYWGWGWGMEPWYGFYGYYFAPYPYYDGPAFWLTDYLLAANLQAAYDAQADASTSFVPRESSPGYLLDAVDPRLIRKERLSFA